LPRRRRAGGLALRPSARPDGNGSAPTWILTGLPGRPPFQRARGRIEAGKPTVNAGPRAVVVLLAPEPAPFPRGRPTATAVFFQNGMALFRRRSGLFRGSRRTRPPSSSSASGRTAEDGNPCQVRPDLCSPLGSSHAPPPELHLAPPDARTGCGVGRPPDVRGRTACARARGRATCLDTDSRAWDRGRPSLAWLRWRRRAGAPSKYAARLVVLEGDAPLRKGLKRSPGCSRAAWLAARAASKGPAAGQRPGRPKIFFPVPPCLLV